MLSDEGRRAEYDRARAAESGATDIRERLLGRLRVYDRARAAESGATEAAPASPSAGAAPKPTRSPAETTAAPPAPEPGQPKGSQFKQERATRDEFVRNAAMSRFHQALKAVGAEYTVAELRGFDVALVPKGRMFSRTKNPRLLGRFVSRVDAEAVGDAWKGAGQWAVPAHEEICVFLMGTSLAPADELATAIAEQRKKRRNMKLTLIPVDARDWDARMPLDAPGIAKTLLARLKSGV
ncbi:MAG: hypothetical protein HY047_02830 [Acidobacteria bacterium]|nr:hypothetical protein [Acidobacteriota bacterium]